MEIKKRFVEYVLAAGFLHPYCHPLVTGSRIGWACADSGQRRGCDLRLCRQGLADPAFLSAYAHGAAERDRTFGQPRAARVILDRRGGRERPCCLLSEPPRSRVEGEFSEAGDHRAQSRRQW